VHEARHDVKYHHSQDADDKLPHHDTLDPLAALSGHSAVKDYCILRLRAARITTHLHHLAFDFLSMQKVINDIYKFFIISL